MVSAVGMPNGDHSLQKQITKKSTIPPLHAVEILWEILWINKNRTKIVLRKDTRKKQERRMRDTTKENLPQSFQLTKLRLLHSLNYGVPSAPRKTEDRIVTVPPQNL